MIIAFACDHGGFPFRETIIHHLENLWHTIIDVWPKDLDPLDDFPDYADILCETILSKKAERWILVCGTGIGMSIAANRHRWIRAVVSYSSQIAKISRSHNDANVICFGGRTMDIIQILESIDIFLTEFFIGNKYQRRNDKIDCKC